MTQLKNQATTPPCQGVVGAAVPGPTPAVARTSKLAGVRSRAQSCCQVLVTCFRHASARVPVPQCISAAYARMFGHKGQWTKVEGTTGEDKHMTYVFRTRINDLAEEIHRSGKGIGKYYESLYSEAPERAEPFIDALWSEAVKFHEFPALTGTRPSPLINVFLYGELRWVPFPLVDDLGRQAFKSRPPEVPHITSLIARLKEKPPRNVNGLDVRVFEDMVGVLQLLEYALIGPLGSTLPGVGGSMPPEIKKALIGTDLDWRDRVTHRSNIHDAFNEYWFADAKRDVGIGATDLDGAGDFETSPLSGEDLDLFDTFSLPKALGVHYRGNGN